MSSDAVTEKIQSIVSSLKIKYLIFSIIFVFIGIIVIINISSYANILSKSDEIPQVPKTRARSGLIVNIVLLILIIGFCGYYIYRFSDQSGFSKLPGFSWFKPKKQGFPSSVVIPNGFSSCADSKPLIKFKDYIEPINLKPKKCIDCKTYPDPKSLSGCKDSYNAQGVLKSVR